MTTHRSTFHQTDRELNAALDETIAIGATKAPKKIPVGISAPKPAPRKTRFHCGDRRIERQLRKPFGELDTSIANGVKAQVALQVYAETAYDSSNPEDELIGMIDRKHDTLGKLLCKIADRAPRHVVHRI